MNNYWLDAYSVHQCNVTRKCTRRIYIARARERITAILHDHNLSREALNVRQRLTEH